MSDYLAYTSGVVRLFDTLDSANEWLTEVGGGKVFIAVARLAAAEAAKPACEWSFDYTHEKWDTTCGEAFILSNDATIEENNMRFCPFCGGHIREAAKGGGDETTDGSV